MDKAVNSHQTYDIIIYLSYLSTYIPSMVPGKFINSTVTRITDFRIVNMMLINCLSDS